MTVEQETPGSNASAEGFISDMAPKPQRRRLALLLSAVGVVMAAAIGVAVAITWPDRGPSVPESVSRTSLSVQAPAQDTVLETTLAPEELRPLTMEEARAFNANLPFSTLPILPARSFIIPVDQIEDYVRAVDCLTAAVYYEAGAETPEGQAAVAQVVINRVRHPAYPNTVCGVVFQGSERSTGCQFTFTCDGAMARAPSPQGWARARAVATSAVNGAVARGAGMATHYHTDWVAPYWAERLVKMRQVGTHIFYRWTGTWGLPSAFSGRYSGGEPLVDKMAPLAIPSESIEPPLVVEMAEIEPATAFKAPVPSISTAPAVTIAPETTVSDSASAARPETTEPQSELAPPPNPLATPEERKGRRPRLATPF